MKATKEIAPSAKPAYVSYRTKRIAALLEQAYEQLGGIDPAVAPEQYEALKGALSATYVALEALTDAAPKPKTRGAVAKVEVSAETETAACS